MAKVQAIYMGFRRLMLVALMMRIFFRILGLPDVIIGLDFHLEELKHRLLKDDNQVLTVSAPGGCGKTTLANMLCHDDELKGVRLVLASHNGHGGEGCNRGVDACFDDNGLVRVF